MTRSFVAAAAVGLAIASLADAQPAAGLAPLSPQLPAGLAIPVLPANAPAVLVRAVESYKANPASLPAYAPALIKSATTPFTPTTKEEHKAEWAKVQAEWKAENPNGYKGMEKAGRRLAGAKGGDGEAGEAVFKVMKVKYADGEASKKHSKKMSVAVSGPVAVEGKPHKGRLLLGGKHAEVDGEAIMTAVVKAPKVVKVKAVKVPKVKIHPVKVPKVKIHAEADVKVVKVKKVKKVHAEAEVSEAGKHSKKGRKLAGHGKDGEAGEAIIKVKMVKAPKAPKYVADEAGEAFGKHGKKHG